MTETQNAAACGFAEIHKAHRYFDAEDASRPCGGRDHGDALNPGEIRTHAVGDQTFQIMHTGNGAYTQVTVRTAGVTTTRVLATHPFENVALRVYAGAIERAEAAAAPEADDVAERPYQPGHPLADREPQVDHNLPMGANPALVYGEPVGLGDVPQDRSADGVPEFEQEFEQEAAPEGWNRVTFTRDGRERIALKCTDGSDRWSLGGSLLHWPSLLIAAGGKVIDATERPQVSPGLYREPLIEVLQRRGRAIRGSASTPAEAPTGTSDRVAAALNELAALRRYLLDHQLGYEKITARLDRAVELLKAEGGPVPQRATAYGLELWQHACGVVDHAGPEQPHPDQCDTCRYFRPLTSDPWHPLYVLTDGAA